MSWAFSRSRKSGVGGTVMGGAKGRSALGRAVGRIGAAAAASERTVGAERSPSSFEQVTRRGLEDLTRQVERLELKINGVFLAMIAAMLAELYRAVVR